MTRFDDLDRALDAYFDLEAAAPEPVGLLDDVRAATATRRPRAGWLARLRHAYWPDANGPTVGPVSARLFVLLVLAGLLVGLIGVSLMIGSRPSLPVVADTSTSPSAPASISTAPSSMAPGAATPFPIQPGEVWIAYMSNVASADSDRIWLVRPDGSDRHQVVTGLDARQEEHPDWSPDGQRLAFDRWLPDAEHPGHDRLDVWTMAADGTDVRLLAACASPCLQLANPDWSPDGTEIVHVRYELVSSTVWGPSAIDITNVTTGVRRTVIESADGATAYYNPRWSADGSEIVFGRETYTDATESTLVSAGVAIAAADGSDGDRPRIVTPPDQMAWAPDWSPTQARILFQTRFDAAESAERAGPTDIYEIRPDGSALTNITNLGLGDIRAIEPSWTPDGKRIVFTQVDGFGGGQIPAIALMDADGGNVARLGFAAGTAGRMRPTP